VKIRGTYPNIERAVVAWLKDQCPTFWIVTEEPTDFADQITKDLPLVVIERIPGGSGGDIDSVALLDVTVYAPSLPALWAATEPIERVFRSMPGRGAYSIDDVRQTSGFGRIPYANTRIRRAVGTFELTSRPR
jgi:hypothetical protein